MHGLLLSVCLAATPPPAEEAPPFTIEGTGRMTFGAGYRLAPNEYFLARASDAGFGVSKRSIGGPAVNASFGFGALDWLEVAIDAYFAYEGFELSGYRPFSAVSYGALLGARVTQGDWPFKGFVPYLSAMSGFSLSLVSSEDDRGAEKLQPGLSLGAGFTIRFAERFGLSFDVKWIYARHFVANIAGYNVGGFWFTVGFTTFFPGPPKRDLDVPRL